MEDEIKLLPNRHSFHIFESKYEEDEPEMMQKEKKKDGEITGHQVRHSIKELRNESEKKQESLLAKVKQFEKEEKQALNQITQDQKRNGESMETDNYKEVVRTSEETLDYLQLLRSQINGCMEFIQKFYVKALNSIDDGDVNWLKKLNDTVVKLHKEFREMLSVYHKILELCPRGKAVERIRQKWGTVKNLGYQLRKFCLWKTALKCGAWASAGTGGGFLLYSVFGYGAVIVGALAGLYFAGMAYLGDKTNLEEERRAAKAKADQHEQFYHVWSSLGEKLDDSSLDQLNELFTTNQQLVAKYQCEFFPETLDEEDCIVCEEPLWGSDDPLVRPNTCPRHYYHKKCLERWQETENQNSRSHKCLSCTLCYTHLVSVNSK